MFHIYPRLIFGIVGVFYLAVNLSLHFHFFSGGF